MDSWYSCLNCQNGNEKSIIFEKKNKGNVMKVLVVYCHPSKNSFTNTIKESFIRGLEDAGHSYEVSDLYAQGFNPIMSESEYTSNLSFIYID